MTETVAAWIQPKAVLTMRNGGTAEIVWTDIGDKFPVAGRRRGLRGEWVMAQWDALGRYFDGNRTSDLDLMPPAPPITVSDAAVQAFRDKSETFRGKDALPVACTDTKAGLAAAFAVMLAERESK